VTVTEVLQETPRDYHLIILMRYTFTDVNLTLAERYINPIGFRVTNYKIDQEIHQ
jgi:type IV secretory pathway component VirB8